MFLTVSWLLTGGIALSLAIVNLIRTLLKKYRGCRILVLASLSCGALAVLCALRMIYVWARAEAIDSLLDVVPTLVLASSWGLILGLVLNLMVLWLNQRVEKGG